MFRYSFVVLLFVSTLLGDEMNAFMDGFDETPIPASYTMESASKSFSLQQYGVEGKLKQEFAYSYDNDAPHDGISSLRTSLFLEYNQDLWKGYTLKVNANSFYDSSYLIKGRDKFTKEERNALESQVELFDAYIQGALFDSLDIKLGRQVVVWGKSDTIRVVDVINPLDNRRPGMVDIEELRLSTTMAKFDYYFDNWSITPIFILEQREDKLPPYGGDFNPSPVKIPTQKKPDEITYALNISGEFSGFDVDFYFANLYPNFEFYPRTDVDITNKITMYGAALAYVYGSLLLKGEFAYVQDYQYKNLANQKLDRVDVLVGLEYNGISETTISIDFANKRFVKDYGIDKDNYQAALRLKTDFFHDTLHANYLLSVFGETFDDGGYQRAWVEYEIADSLKSTLGVVDYLGGNTFFDAISDNDMIFGDISYSF